SLRERERRKSGTLLKAEIGLTRTFQMRASRTQRPISNRELASIFLRWAYIILPTKVYRMKRFGFWRRFPCLLAAMTAISLPYAASAQSIATTPNSVIRPSALNDIPQHLAEIGWDTDVPSLFVIRFQP